MGKNQPQRAKRSGATGAAGATAPNGDGEGRDERAKEQHCKKGHAKKTRKKTKARENGPVKNTGNVKRPQPRSEAIGKNLNRDPSAFSGGGQWQLSHAKRSFKCERHSGQNEILLPFVAVAGRWPST